MLSQLVRQKMDWFLVHQVKPEILNNITIQNSILNFQFNLELDFPARARVQEINTHKRAVVGKSFPNVLTKQPIHDKIINYQTNFESY